jgi:hypothetical protein
VCDDDLYIILICGLEKQWCELKNSIEQYMIIQRNRMLYALLIATR